MVKIVGVGFKEVGKIYWFNPGYYSLKKGDKIVVETVRGIEMGHIVEDIKEIEESSLEHELKPVIRIANKNDVKQYYENLERAERSLEICRAIINNHKLEMKLLDCEYTLDKQKIIIYYNSEGRVDFRELLKDLASEFKVRIELRQVGPREGAKFIGGIGCCGREICCKSHLREFGLVTMKMAKDQGIALNASKVAGLCGKLMCCIGYENKAYEDVRRRIPLVGDIVKTPGCAECKVINVDFLREIIRTENGEKIEEWPADKVVKVKGHQEEISSEDLTDDVIEK